MLLASCNNQRDYSLVNDSSAEEAEPTITFRGQDIRTLSRDDLLEALQEGFAELVSLRARLSDEGKMEAAREEDFQRDLRARRDFFGAAAEFQSRLFDASTAYNQLIVIGGYGAFFAVWSAFASHISRVVLLLSGMLMTISLVVYVTWTVVNMYRLQGSNIAASETFGEGVEGFEERYQAAIASGHGKSAELLRYWKPVVWLAGLTGLGAALLLGGAAFVGIATAGTESGKATYQLGIVEHRTSEAAAKAECSARVAELYSRSRGGPGSTATNPKTGQHAVLIEDHWAILPRC